MSVMAATVLVASSCSASHSATPAAQKAKTTPAVFIGPNAPAATSQPTLDAAISGLLTAEMQGNHAASFVLLSDEGRQSYKDIFRWRDRRAELPSVTGFKIAGSGKAPDSLEVLVDHHPGLNPFIGLSPATDHEEWVGRQEHGGWLVDPDATSDPILPPDSGVQGAVTAWIDAAQRCDKPSVVAAQAIEPILGVADAADQLCGTKLTFVPGPPSKVGPGTATQQLVAQYNADSLTWARSVSVTGGKAPIQVVVAPIGSTWKVVGVFS